MAKKKRNGLRARMDKTLSTIKSPAFRVGFSDIDLWISMGNYAMNRLWSGRFDKAFLFGRNYVFYGESGSGKSLMCAIAAGEAQRTHDAMVVWIDVEHANDDDAGKEWLRRAGIDVDDDEKFMYASAATLESIKTVISEAALAQEAMIKDGEEPQPMVIVVDSWAAALTETQMERTLGKEAGVIKGDMGQKAKQTGDVLLSVTHACAGKPLMVLGVQHIMDNQDGYGRKHKTTGGHKMVFMASGCLMLTKKELKLEDVEDVETQERYEELHSGMTAAAKKQAGGDKRAVGITATMEILKSRVSKPFEKIDIQIPYNKGLDPYSGLFHLMQQEAVIKVTSPGWYQYTNADGKEIKFRAKEFLEHAEAIMAAADADISKADAEDAEIPTVVDAGAIMTEIEEDSDE